MVNTYLKKAYGTRNASETRALYDGWAASYDVDISENGYATPVRCAEALARFTKDFSAPVLDFGCGTGLSGAALKSSGFETIDGADISADMLRGAKTKNLYRALNQIEPNTLPIKTQGDYAAIAAIGVIGSGAAPISVFDMLMQGLGSGGKLVFSFNDHALEDPAHEARVSEWTDCGAARLLFREYGPHLPGINLNSNVYVIEKA